MKDLKLSAAEHERLFEEYKDRAEVAAVMFELLTPEMMSKEIGSSEVKAHLEKVDALLQMLEKDDVIRRGACKIQ